MQLSWKKSLLVSALAGADGALIAYFVCAFIPPEHGGFVDLLFAAMLWTVAACVAGTGASVRNLGAISIGFSWGFLVAMSLAISLQNWRVSVYWRTFLPALVLIPIGLFISVLPFRLLRRYATSVTALGLGGVILGLIVLATRFEMLPVYKKSAPPGNYDLVGIVSVPENSIPGMRIEQTPATGSPTLTLDVRDEVGEPLAAESLSIPLYMVKNLGDSTIPGGTYDIEFYLDQQLVSFDRATGDLKPGGFVMQLLEDRMRRLEPGTHSYKLVLDRDNRLRELDEQNNVAQGSLEVIRQTDVPHDQQE